MKKMKILLIISIFASSLYAQDSISVKNDSLFKMLSGVWEIEKIIDKDGDEVNSITRAMPGSPLGDEIQIKATGPDMRLNADGTYELGFIPNNTDTGNWYCISPDTLILQNVTEKGTSSYHMLKSAAEAFGLTLTFDAAGNIVENVPKEIVSLKKDRLLIRYEKIYYQVYVRKK